MYRPAGQRMVGGVAQGLADHLRVPVLWVRLAFVVATWFNLAGVIAYAGFWMFVPLGDGRQDAPGIESATRRGLRTGGAFPRLTSRDVVQTAALLALGIGVVLLMSVFGWGLGGSLFIPLLIGVAGLTLIWRQADDRRWNRWVVETSGWHAVTRLALGGLLIAMALGFFLVGTGGIGVATDVLSALVIALLGAALILGPWIYRLTHDLTEERRERIRSQERADVAAHLHDSVLQTLALLQKNAADPGTVATLARRQERELREWLYGDSDRPGETLRATLAADAADIEEMHHVPIEVVGVGDAPMDGDVAAMARAAREAMTNAAKHSGAER
ncbi:MAG: PspC domain-containing protein, partial [Nocardioidaceae bacterium]